ncbi:MAG: TetR/AcrR family transcriptional regulator [Polyangiales bacterium]
MARPSKKSALLRAAARIVKREGADALTLDAVAVEAGVSKGGLLYHFDSKEALVKGLVEMMVEGFDEALDRDEDRSPGAFSRAYLRSTAETDEAALSVTYALLAAVAIAPESIEPLRERYRRWNKRLRDDGISEETAFIVRLAADGLWLADLLGLEPPKPKLRRAIVQRLLELTREEQEVESA